MIEPQRYQCDKNPKGARNDNNNLRAPVWEG